LKEEQEKKIAEEAIVKAEQEKVSHMPVVSTAGVHRTFNIVTLHFHSQKLKEEQEKNAAEEARIKAEQEKVRFGYLL